jgi:hypothetical protein
LRAAYHGVEFGAIDAIAGEERLQHRVIQQIREDRLGDAAGLF